VQALRLIDAWPVPTRAAAVVRPDGSIDTAGDQEDFRIAPVAKPITAWACLIAIEEGIVSLDLPIGQPGCTLTHLLSHAGGYGFDGPDPIAKPERNRIYSNTGIEMAAAAVADAAGMAFGDYLAEAVLRPLAMTSTTLHGSPAHGMRSTAADLIRFVTEVRTPTLISAGTEAQATVATGVNLEPATHGSSAWRRAPGGSDSRCAGQTTTLDRHNELAENVWTFRWGRYLHMGGSCRGGGVRCPDRSPIR
jgi:CubicO group peptidase (beta-lactamase class C family)